LSIAEAMMDNSTNLGGLDVTLGKIACEVLGKHRIYISSFLDGGRISSGRIMDVPVTSKTKINPVM
jgi:hypothetical protein